MEKIEGTWVFMTCILIMLVQAGDSLARTLMENQLVLPRDGKVVAIGSVLKDDSGNASSHVSICHK